MVNLVEHARGLRSRLAPERARIEEERGLTPAAVEALASIDTFRMLVPKSLGGLEVSPRVFVETLEALAEIDSAVGWTAMVTGSTGLCAAYLEPSVARALWTDASAAVSGVFAPSGRAVREGDDYVISGRWSFGSASGFSRERLLGVLVEDGDRVEVRQVIVPATQMEVVDTWHVSGLRGTGSHDLVAKGARVPVSRSLALGIDRPREHGSVYRFPLFGILAAGVAAVALGIARTAVREGMQLAATKRPMGGKRSLAEREIVQADLARAEASLRGGRAFLLEVVDTLSAREGATLTARDKAELRLAATYATERAAAAVDLVHRVVGSTAIYESHPFARAHRDVHVATQHAMVADAIHVLAGRVLLGLPTDESTL